MHPGEHSPCPLPLLAEIKRIGAARKALSVVVSDSGLLLAPNPPNEHLGDTSEDNDLVLLARSWTWLRAELMLCLRGVSGTNHPAPSFPRCCRHQPWGQQ